jgi:hypothetical protein
LRVVSNESTFFKVFDRGSRAGRVRANTDSHPGGMMVEGRDSAFALMPTDQSSSNPAAGRNGQGARMTRKDGCHPKSKNHGRIAGR